MKIQFGALADPLHEQMNLPKEKMELAQRLADSITLGQIHLILTDSEVSKARKRIFKMLKKEFDL